MKRITITDWSHQIVKKYVKEGDNCIDATAGKGNDTLFLSNLVGKSGKVISFDIQQEAVEATKKLLLDSKISCNYNVILDSHVNMDKYIFKDSVSAVMFNLGYLPGGNHNIQTKYNTTIEAINVALELLKAGGIISICIYSGGDSGFIEKDKVLEYLRKLDNKKYLVIYNEFYNKPNNPPIPVFIFKL